MYLAPLPPSLAFLRKVKADLRQTRVCSVNERDERVSFTEGIAPSTGLRLHHVSLLFRSFKHRLFFDAIMSEATAEDVPRWAQALTDEHVLPLEALGKAFNTRVNAKHPLKSPGLLDEEANEIRAAAGLNELSPPKVRATPPSDDFDSN